MPRTPVVRRAAEWITWLPYARLFFLWLPIAGLLAAALLAVFSHPREALHRFEAAAVLIAVAKILASIWSVPAWPWSSAPAHAKPAPHAAPPDER